jgi:hypothetical protein
VVLSQRQGGRTVPPRPVVPARGHPQRSQLMVGGQLTVDPAEPLEVGQGGGRRPDLLGTAAVFQGELRQSDLGPGPDLRIGSGGTRIIQQPPQPLPTGHVPAAEPPPARQGRRDP